VPLSAHLHLRITSPHPVPTCPRQMRRCPRASKCRWSEREPVAVDLAVLVGALVEVHELDQEVHGKWANSRQREEGERRDSNPRPPGPQPAARDPAALNLALESEIASGEFSPVSLKLRHDWYYGPGLSRAESLTSGDGLSLSWARSTSDQPAAHGRWRRATRIVKVVTSSARLLGSTSGRSWRARP
jgi:hypothetical protein